MANIKVALAVGCIVFGAVGCRPSGSREAVGDSGLRTFAVTGTVHEVRLEAKEVVIAHQVIPGYMQAMTMPFEVKDTNEIADVRPADVLTFRLLVNETEGWIDSVRKVGRDPSVSPGVRKGPRVVRLVDPLRVGDTIPDYPLTNQLGELFHLSDYRGQVLGLSFFFTRCPYPNFCPRTSANMAATAEALSATNSGITNWHLMQVSFDPDNDTPAVLKAYGERYGCDPARWTLATGDMVEIDAITEQFGMEIGREGEFFNHNVRTAVLDPAGKVSLIITGNTWKVEELVDAMKAAVR